MLATAQNRRPPPHGLLAHTINHLSRTVARPSDSEDEVLRKAVLAFMVEMGIVVAIVWASAYLLLGFPIAAAIPTTIGVVSLLGLVYLFWTKDYRPVLEANIILVLSLSFLLQWILGGFNASGGVMLWAIMAPLASLLFQSGRRALFWFLVYIVLTIISGVIDGRMAQHAVHLPEPVVVASFVMNFLGVSVVFYLVIHYFVSQLQTAKAESERLLLNILPAPVAQRIKDGETLIADQLDDVTVVFADIAGFTPLSAQLPPGDVVAMLNDLFSAFDELANRHGLEKIRTMGDSYMAVAGAPSWRPDHAQIAAEMALDMLAIVDSYARGPLSQIQIRIGINTGPVTAGVIGKQKFAYDVYGDTVNTASRMESQGVPGWIQVTETTYRRLQWDYCLEPRGHVEVKGKGDMMTYWLRQRRDERRTA